MNANPKFLAATAHVDDAAVKPLPNSRKIYVGPLRMPIARIAQSSGNPPLAVTTSGPTPIRRRRSTFERAPVPPELDRGARRHAASSTARARRTGASASRMRSWPSFASSFIASVAEVRHANTTRRRSSHRKWNSSPCAKISGSFQPGDAARGPVVRRRDPGRSPRFVRSEMARGRAIIPANINHPETEPWSLAAISW